MITAAEAGLTTEQYEYLRDSLLDAVFDVKLYQWDPELVTTDVAVSSNSMFDAIIHDGKLYKVTPWRLTADGVIQDFLPIDMVTGSSPSLVSDADLYIFFPTSTGISLSTFDGTVHSAWTEIVTQSDIAYIAATTSDTVHFITFDATTNNYRFHVAVYDGSWTVTDSNVYWGYGIISFAAKRVGTKDSLIIASDTPGVISMKVVATKVVKEILPSGGIFGFNYKYGTWSDHYEIDRVDQWSEFRYRSRLNLSTIEGVLWLTSYSSEGSVDYPITGYRIYSSKDGRHWSRGELFPLENILTEGFILLSLSSTLYAVAYNQTYSGDMTLKFGTPHTDTILDVTTKIKELSVNRNQIQQVNLVLDNQDDWLLTSIANGLHSLALKMQTGFASGTGNVLIDTGLLEVDTIQAIKDVPLNVYSITARDRLAWLADKSQSEQFVNWSPQSVGVDEYVDTTGTGFGGMTHTIPVEGSWKAADNVLSLVSSNKEGIAYSTWLYDNWNGTVEHWFELSQAANDEYAGLVFRSPDKDNGFFYFYNQDDDKLYLTNRVAGTPTTVWSSSAKTWSSPTNGYFLRVDFKYSRVLLFSSATSTPGASGVQWVLEAEVIVDGQAPVTELGITPLIQSGYVGTFGKGFSDIDSSVGDPGPISDGDVPYPPYVPPPGVYPDADNVPTITGQLPLGGIRIDAVSAVAEWADGFDTVLHTTTWSDRSTGKTGVGGPAYSDPFNYETLFNFSSAGLEKLTNQSKASSYQWSLLHSNLTLYGDADARTYRCAGSHLVLGWGMALGTNGVRVITTDGWQTFTQVSYSAGGSLDHFWICGHDANHLIFCITRQNCDEAQWWLSTDGGLTLGTKLQGFAICAHSGAADFNWVFIPYVRRDGSSNTDDSSLLAYPATSTIYGSNRGGALYRSVDKLANFEAAVFSNTGGTGDFETYERGGLVASVHTWDADWIAAVYDNYVSTTIDGGTTIRSTIVSAGSNITGINGWPMVGTDDPNVGIWVAWSIGITYPGVWITYDNNQSWTQLSSDPTSYFELALAGLI